MNARYLKLIFLGLLPLLTTGFTYANPASPTCFSDVDSFMMKRYGPDFRDDENLKLSKVIYGKVEFSVFEDVTSGTNHSFVLLKKNNNEEMCVVLRTPPTAQLELIKIDAAGVPQEFKTVDQASPGYPQKEVFYRLTSSMKYIASVCNAITWKNNRAMRKRVACDRP